MFDHPLFVPITVAVLAVLQVFIFIALLRLSARISRLFALIASPVPPAAQELADRKESNSEQKKWFAEFLAEDPARKALPKKEQFAQFRRWREAKGLNWKSPVDSA